MSVEIPLVNSDKPAIVDDENAYFLRHEWFLSPEGYAVRFITKGGQTRCIAMHDEVMGVNLDGYEVKECNKSCDHD